MGSGPEKQLKIGILGCGAIAQAGHFESVAKARNTTLHAICDVAEDLLQRFSVTYGAAKVYTQYERMLADPDLDAVIIATADAFHVPAALDALAAGKHVLCEKPLGIALDEVEALREAVSASGRKLQVGHMKRFDPGIESARSFINDEMGQMLAFKGWYCDSTHRYPMTDAVQPLIIRSAAARKPARDPKQDLQQYYMLAHGCHLVDTARFLCGDLVEVQARHLQRFGAHSWFVDVAFANGALGHLDLTVAVRMDWNFTPRCRHLPIPWVSTTSSSWAQPAFFVIYFPSKSIGQSYNMSELARCRPRSDRPKFRARLGVRKWPRQQGPSAQSSSEPGTPSAQYACCRDAASPLSDSC